jgi:hypothetical protein
VIYKENNEFKKLKAPLRKKLRILEAYLSGARAKNN